MKKNLLKVVRGQQEDCHGAALLSVPRIYHTRHPAGTLLPRAHKAEDAAAGGFKGLTALRVSPASLEIPKGTAHHEGCATDNFLPPSHEPTSTQQSPAEVSGRGICTAFWGDICFILNPSFLHPVIASCYGVSSCTQEQR